MFRSRSLPLVAVAALAASAAHAGEPVKLDKAEVEKTVTGKSISYTNVNGSPAVILLGADGKATYKVSNMKSSSGTWTVEDNGRFCIKIISGTAVDQCRSLYKTDAGYSLSAPARGADLVPVAIE